MSETKHIFEHILDGNEQILWSEAPKFIPFLVPILAQFLTLIAFALFAFLGAFVIGIGPEKRLIDISDIGAEDFTTLTFFMIGSLGALGILIARILSYTNTQYALTTKRILFRSGFFGIDYKSIDHDKVSEILVDINIVEKLCKCGSIKAFTGRITNKGSRQHDTIIGIENPYEVFKQFKTVNTDIKTDISYPNALRPQENPGYNTQYTPNEQTK